ncbi:glucosamine-6-phosphate deaminase [Paenibacillus sp.]|uniref:glucosamine-6-phosphate deaminase n=1 Tax=Paenibacillus sp. TaxID=58172 RepID=UPI002D37154A|nr:glucosamine-6-phosphate deaminase [Paenibacillus sp.]HZG84308.1 glucosamine-6-phosphate deaminase [Paenibacillus sp.]
MNVEIKQNYEEVSQETAQRIAAYVAAKPDSLLCLAAGNTPLGAYRILREMAQEKKVDFSRCTFVGLDEWAGMDRHSDGSAQEMMYRDFFDPLGIRPEQIVYFDAASDDLEAECRRIDAYIEANGPIDLMLLGIGVNGHLGLNEPGVDFASRSHVTALSETTVTVGQKYFKESRELTGGVTLGIAQVMESRTVLLVASGENKAAAVRGMLHGEVTNALPASILQRHADCTAIVDKAAAGAAE